MRTSPRLSGLSDHLRNLLEEAGTVCESILKCSEESAKNRYLGWATLVASWDDSDGPPSCFCSIPVGPDDTWFASRLQESTTEALEACAFDKWEAWLFSGLRLFKILNAH